MARIPRFYISNPSQYSVDLSPQQSHHLLRVLRYAQGAVLRVFHPLWGEWEGPWDGKSTVHITQQIHPAPPRSYGFVCLFALCKRYRDILEKGSELGVDAFYPCITRYSLTSSPALHRLESFVIHAAEQSGQIAVPKVHPLQPLQRAIESFGGNILRLDFGGTTSPPRQTPQGLLIGPEGGWHPSERHWGTPWCLGPNILRSETAAIAGIARWHALGS